MPVFFVNVRTVPRWVPHPIVALIATLFQKFLGSHLAPHIPVVHCGIFLFRYVPISQTFSLDCPGYHSILRHLPRSLPRSTTSSAPESSLTCTHISFSCLSGEDQLSHHPLSNGEPAPREKVSRHLQLAQVCSSAGDWHTGGGLRWHRSRNCSGSPSRPCHGPTGCGSRRPTPPRRDPIAWSSHGDLRCLRAATADRCGDRLVVHTCSVVRGPMRPAPRPGWAWT